VLYGNLLKAMRKIKVFFIEEGPNWLYGFKSTDRCTDSGDMDMANWIYERGFLCWTMLEENVA
jgi:hypothetical protein